MPKKYLESITSVRHPIKMPHTPLHFSAIKYLQMKVLSSSNSLSAVAKIWPSSAVIEVFQGGPSAQQLFRSLIVASPTSCFSLLLAVTAIG